MKKYQVMIDGEVSSQTFTFDEMIEIGLLDDYDENIKVKVLGESEWKIAREYPFYISESSPYTWNNDGTVTRKKRPKDDVGYTIDEYGQIKRKESKTQVDSFSGTLNTTISEVPQTSRSTSSDDDNSGCIWVVIIGVGIMILSTIL